VCGGWRHCSSELQLFSVNKKTMPFHFSCLTPVIQSSELHPPFVQRCSAHTIFKKYASSAPFTPPTKNCETVLADFAWQLHLLHVMHMCLFLRTGILYIQDACVLSLSLSLSLSLPSSSCVCLATIEWRLFANMGNPMLVGLVVRSLFSVWCISPAHCKAINGTGLFLH